MRPSASRTRRCGADAEPREIARCNHRSQRRCDRQSHHPIRHRYCPRRRSATRESGHRWRNATPSFRRRHRSSGPSRHCRRRRYDCRQQLVAWVDSIVRGSIAILGGRERGSVRTSNLIDGDSRERRANQPAWPTRPRNRPDLVGGYSAIPGRVRCFLIPWGNGSYYG